MKFLMPILIFMTAFLSCSKPKMHPVEYYKPELVSINLVDRNGMSETISQKDRLQQYASVNFLQPQSYQKVLRVFSRDPSGSIKACITSYYPNGQLKQYLEVKDNRANGFYREWFTDGTLKLETYVIGGVADLNPSSEKTWLFEGTSRVFDDCGNLIATIDYCKGELTGSSRYYHKNGKLWKIIPFKKNLAEGTFETYLENGELFQTSELSNDVRHGKTIRYWSKTELAADETYVEGRLITGYYYDPCGSKVAEIQNGNGLRAVFGKSKVCELQEFKNGVQDGEVKIFDLNSNISKIYHVKNELRHGLEIEFYHNSTQPKISISWWEGNIHGVVKTWYENGTAESQREMTNNMKNGVLTGWYKDGSVMLLESYDHDKLVKGKYFKRQEKTALSEVVNGTGLVVIHDPDGNLLKKISYFNGKPQD